LKAIIVAFQTLKISTSPISIAAVWMSRVRSCGNRDGITAYGIDALESSEGVAARSTPSGKA
jgi:hypothetical protein